ncbi:MAG: AAA family ATPase [Pseudomonadota bacterium]|nr:AAA family ATPase [Pseudomonadota bacterium]
MTSYNPNLQISRMKVVKRGFSVFDEAFHTGLNIIRGQNSSGKSTIMDFLFFGLGGDLAEPQWREAAASCDVVLLEIVANGSVLTLMRDVERKASRPMKVFYGPIDEAESSATAGWEVYPFSRGSKDSFSQVIFRVLGLPEVQYGENNTKITMNQILRLLYSDQLSPVDHIFRRLPFDDAITKQTVGDLLLGAFSNKYYSAKLRLKEVEDEISDLSRKIRITIQTYGNDKDALTTNWIDARQSELDRKIDKINDEISDIERKIFDSQFEDRLTLNDQERAFEKVVRLQTEISELKEKISYIDLEIADSQDFIGVIEKKILQLQESESTIGVLDTMAFEFCPACLTPVKQHKSAEHCNLCKAHFTPEQTMQRAARMVQDHVRQKDSSERVQKERAKERTTLLGKLNKATELWETASRDYSLRLKTPTSELRSKLRSLNRDAGYLYREREELSSKRSVVSELEALFAQRDALTRELEGLKTQIRVEERRQIDQKAHARDKIEKKILDFLRRDLERQSTFLDAQTVKFEFDGDRLSVNEETYFSASSMVYLRNSFFAALAIAAANDPSFSHPRLLLMDTVEDKGMEPERSQNFQRLLYEESLSAKSTHQFIIATSMVDPALDRPGITVGQAFTHTNRTLQF